MTLVRLIYLLKWTAKEQVNVVVMGGSAKAEERIFCQTDYFEELTHFYPDVSFQFYFAGPELS
jgi:DeoR/GlpR family transcriptional regulator of sugar metabolism